MRNLQTILSFLTDTFGKLGAQFLSISFNDIVDIALLAVVLYYVYRFVRERRAGKLALGLAILVVFYALTAIFEMHAMSFLLQNVFQVGLLALIILFQPELRAALEKVGGDPLRSIRNLTEPKEVAETTRAIDNICIAASDMARDRTGALIVIERTTKLGDIMKTGVQVDAVISQSLIKNIFFNKAALHDGAMIIRDNRIAAESIGEPGTQLTMRTFHVGGTATTAFKQPIVKAKNDGRVIYTEDLRTVENVDGNFVVLNKNCSVRIENEQGRELESYQPVIGTILYVPNGGSIKKDETLATWDPYNVPVIAEKGGMVEFKDMIVGITVSKETDRETGTSTLVVMEHKQELHPQVVIRDVKTREVLAHHAIPAGANLTVKDGETISAGTMVAKTPRKVAKTKDITGGLPRVAELFEARKPKDACTIARVEGIVRLSSKNTSRGKKVITIETPTGELVDHLVPMNKHVIVHEDDHVHMGDQLTEGPVSPEEILDVCGKERLQEHLVNEVQEVYRLQGVEINDKHVEIIVRQMLRKVVITEPGNTEFLWGDQVDKTTFDRINEQTIAQGGQPAAAKPVLLGITKASLETESFISAASFQDTTRVLTEASTLGKTDTLEGFKENVIMGHLIPAGTGFSRYSKIEVDPAEGAEEIVLAGEDDEMDSIEEVLNDTINFDNER